MINTSGVLQVSVATRFACGEIFNDSFIANFPASLPVKEFWKSVENWQSYRSSLVYYMRRSENLQLACQFSSANHRVVSHLSTFWDTVYVYLLWL